MDVPSRIVSLGSFVLKKEADTQIMPLKELLGTVFLMSAGYDLLRWLRTCDNPRRSAEFEFDEKTSFGTSVKKIIAWVNAETPLFVESNSSVSFSPQVTPELKAAIGDFVRGLPRPKPTP